MTDIQGYCLEITGKQVNKHIKAMSPSLNMENNNGPNPVSSRHLIESI